VGEQLFLPPQLVNQAVKDMFRLLESAQEKLPPVLFGIRFHKDLIFIHPFMDGNGRVARLAMNTVLLQHKYLPIDISPDKIMEYHKSITATYEDSTAFYKFMLQQAIQSYEFLLQKLKLRDLK
jgi:Fic family protein